MGPVPRLLGVNDTVPVGIDPSAETTVALTVNGVPAGSLDMNAGLVIFVVVADFPGGGGGGGPFLIVTRDVPEAAACVASPQ
jgi:hypothetical protein